MLEGGPITILARQLGNLIGGPVRLPQLNAWRNNSIF